MQKHLEACWECRHELQQIEGAIGGAVEYRRQMRAHMPAPPAPWRDLTSGFEAIDRTLAPPSVWQRIDATATRSPFRTLPEITETLGREALTLESSSL